MSYPGSEPDGRQPVDGRPAPPQAIPPAPAPFEPPTQAAPAVPASPFAAPAPFGAPAPFTPTDPAPTQPVTPAPAASTDPAPTQPVPAYGEAYGYQPTSAVPLSGPPVSGAPPVSGMPGFGQPGYPPVSGIPQPGYGQPPAGRRVAVPVLASLAALFLIAAAVMSGLFIAKNNAYHRQSTTLHGTINSQKAQLDKDSDQLKELQSKLDDETQKATGSANQVQELTHEKQVISQCLDLSGQAVDAAEKGDITTANKLEAQAGPICDEAEGYLD